MNLETLDGIIKNPNWGKILENLNHVKGGFVNLENLNGDYIQCAGHESALTIEYRINLRPGFKHFVIGKGENKSPLKVNWRILNTKVGEIMVHEEEVLKLEDAKIVFKEFFENNRIPENLNKRNITKMFK